MSIVDKIQEVFEDKMGIELTKKQVTLIIVCVILFITAFVLFFTVERAKSDPAGTKLESPKTTAPLFEKK